MDMIKYSEPTTGKLLCASCGIPADAEYFDESSVTETPALGRTVVLASFKLAPQYCGVLQYFSQFTDASARNHAAIQTQGLVWQLRANGRPLYPYVQMRQILNPWGYGSFPVAIRLDDSATVEFVVRRTEPAPSGVPQDQQITQVGGRIMGRFWYNPSYGDAN
jgi:hypothetical protein